MTNHVALIIGVAGQDLAALALTPNEFAIRSARDHNMSANL